MIPPRDLSRLELAYTAGEFGWEHYVRGLHWRCTRLSPFRHFASLHARYTSHLWLLFRHLDGLPRDHAIYRGTNGLPTASKASAYLARLPESCYRHYRFAVRIAHGTWPAMVRISDPVLAAEWREFRRSEREEWRALALGSRDLALYSRSRVVFRKASADPSRPALSAPAS